MAKRFVMQSFALEVEGPGEGGYLGLRGHASCVDNFGRPDLLGGVVGDVPMSAFGGIELWDFYDAIDIGLEQDAVPDRLAGVDMVIHI